MSTGSCFMTVFQGFSRNAFGENLLHIVDLFNEKMTNGGGLNLPGIVKNSKELAKLYGIKVERVEENNKLMRQGNGASNPSLKYKSKGIKPNTQTQILPKNPINAQIRNMKKTTNSINAQKPTILQSANNSYIQNMRLSTEGTNIHKHPLPKNVTNIEIQSKMKVIEATQSQGQWKNATQSQGQSAKNPAQGSAMGFQLHSKGKREQETTKENSRKKAKTSSVENEVAEEVEHVHEEELEHVQEDELDHGKELEHLQEEETPEVEIMAPEPSPPKKTRGPTKCIDIWDSNHPIIHVGVNIRGQPIGRAGRRLTTFLGSVARKGDLVPLDYFDWREVPQVMKDYVWEIVEGKFQFFPIETYEMKGWVLRDVGLKWKDWKANLKSLFYDDATDMATIVANATNARTLDVTQFENLVKYWRTDDAKKTSSINMENTSKWDQPHNAGTMSFARLAEEMAKILKRTPEPWEIYVKTRSREKGTYTSNKAKEVVKNIGEIVENFRSQPTFSEGETSMPRDLLATAMNKPERKGRERCVGLQAPAKERRKTSSTPLQSSASFLQEHEQLKIDYEDLKNENAELKANLEKLRSELGKVTDMWKAVAEKLGM